MKAVIVLLSVFTVATFGKSLFNKDNYPADFVNIVKSYGYPVESYDVQTEDGYILTLFRISGGQTNRKFGPKNQAYSSSSSEEADKKQSSSSSSEEGGNRGPVFLMHGLQANSESFIYGGPSQGLAFYLADAGYDVYLGNARGSIYGQRHTTLNPQKDAAFWKYCWQQIGVKDLPALVNKALAISGQNLISYIGHNEGTTAFYVLASEYPEINKKFDKQISLGPIAFLQNSDNAVFNSIGSHLNSKSWIMKNVGMFTFSPSNDLLQVAEANCVSQRFQGEICQNAYFLVNGYNSNQFNKTTVNQFIHRVPSPASVREIMHFAQLKASGRFQKWSEEAQAEEYDLSKVTVPVAIFYTPQDSVSHVSDVQLLASKLPNVYTQQAFQQLSNNLDLLYSEQVATNVYSVIVRALQANPQQNNPQQNNPLQNNPLQNNSQQNNEM